MSVSVVDALDFELPRELEAHEPPEARGLARDGVRMMVSRVSDDAITHTRFRRLADHLAPRDVVVVNRSATINAAFDATRENRARKREHIRLHLSTELSPDLWVIELRRLTSRGSTPLLTAEAGERMLFRHGGEARLIAPFMDRAAHIVRLWIARLVVPARVSEYAARNGFPIRYGYVPRHWPLDDYQTVFAREPGSAEMPSAGRPFTPQMVRTLKRKRVRIAPIVLHCGVSSLETHESPYPERYRVPAVTAAAVNNAHAYGARVFAVGTTVVRALETVASPDGHLRAGQGWTDVVVTPERGVRAVDALLTGLHAPDASHLSMLQAFAGSEHIAAAYAEAARHGYRWHEFGDLHLIIR